MKNSLLLLFLLAQQLAFSQDFNAVVNDYSINYDFNGVVGISASGQVKYLTSKGIADRQLDVKILGLSKFKICSITKTFTAVMVLQLNEQGKLDLNATIGKYLPNYKGEGLDKVTLHQLLTYSSGIPNCEGDMGLGIYQRAISTDDFIDKYCSGNLQSEPGSQFNYQNGEYIILGRIIEVVTGKSYQANLHERILQPSGMKNTDFQRDFDVVEGLVNSYWFDDSTKVYNNDPPYYIQNYYAAGAIYSTSYDMLLFDEAVFSSKLFSKKTLDLMLTPYPELYGVAYGFWVYEIEIGGKKVKVADRQGGIWGSNSTWLHAIDENAAVIILSNTNTTDINEMRAKLMELALEKK